MRHPLHLFPSALLTAPAPRARSPCTDRCLPVATDRSDRLQAEFFLRFSRPSFPFRVCTGPEDAADRVLHSEPQSASCWRLNHLINDFFIATPNPAVDAANGDGYPFWTFDPNGSYSRRVFPSGVLDNGWADADPNDACYLRFAWLQSDPVPFNVRLNIAVRTRINGVFGELGSAAAPRAMVATCASAPATTAVWRCGSRRPVVGACSTHRAAWWPREGAIVRAGRASPSAVPHRACTCCRRWGRKDPEAFASCIGEAVVLPNAGRVVTFPPPKPLRMNRTLTLFGLLIPLAASAAQGGPDTYGYIWKDSNEPGGPVFNWIDITGTGFQVTGLADDNVVGPFAMFTNMPFYWYDRKDVWIGSNGYIAFNSTNIASPFPNIPQAGGANDYIAGLTADLTFTGAGNPGQCWVYDTPDTTIFSWISVPFWSATPPTWTGSNTFQIILNKLDSTITVQILEQTGFTQNNDLLLGIECISGDIGLQHSADVYPVANYAIRYYAPQVPLLAITDGAVRFVGADGSRGVSLQRNGPAHPLVMQVRNTGNQLLTNVTAQAQVFTPNNQLAVSDQVTIASLTPGADSLITFPIAFAPSTNGTHRYVGTISGIPNELVTTNNTRTQELAVYDTTLAVQQVRWNGGTDDGIGIGWNGGNGGVGVYLDRPPFSPCYVTGYTVRLTTNLTPVGMYLKVFADDGPNGGPGTRIDSIYVQPANAVAGDQVHAVGTPFLWDQGGLYVQWYMGGNNINIAQDITAPFSLHTYEVLDNVWAEYRDRETTDFHLGLRVEQLPVYDVGCSGFFGVVDGQVVTQPTIVRTWVKNSGNQAASGFPVNYRFAAEPVVTQNFPSTLQPGDSLLFTFTQALLPTSTQTGALCAWSDWTSDITTGNDTVCVNLDVVAGIAEHAYALLDVRPNPASDRVTLSGYGTGGATVDLVDLSGALVRRWTLRAGDNATLALDGVAPGSYLYQVTTPDRRFTGKLVVHR